MCSSSATFCLPIATLIFMKQGEICHTVYISSCTHIIKIIYRNTHINTQICKYTPTTHTHTHRKTHTQFYLKNYVWWVFRFFPTTHTHTHTQKDSYTILSSFSIFSISPISPKYFFFAGWLPCKDGMNPMVADKQPYY